MATTYKTKYGQPGLYNSVAPTLPDGAGGALAVDVNGNVKVNVVAGAAGGTSATDDAAFTAGTGTGTPSMGFVTSDSVDSGDVGVFAMLANRQQKVTLYDSSGVELAVGGGTQYTEDAAAAANPVGNSLNLVRDDARGGSLTSADGDNVAARGTNSGELYVKHVDSIPPGTGATNLGKAEDAAHTSGDVGVAVLTKRTDSAASSAGTDGDYATLNTDNTGRLWVNLAAYTATSLTPGTGATNLGKAEDAAHTSSDTGVYALAVRDDSPAAHSGTDGDYESLHVSAEGGLWTTGTPSASGGLSIFRSLDLDETEEEVKATAGTVYGMWVTNTATTTIWLKFYNATAANVTVGTTTPVITWGIPGNSSDDVSGLLSNGGTGIAFDTAITVAATTGVADNDTGAPAANDIIVNIFYK